MPNIYRTFTFINFFVGIEHYNVNMTFVLYFKGLFYRVASSLFNLGLYIWITLIFTRFSNIYYLSTESIIGQNISPHDYSFYSRNLVTYTIVILYFSVNHYVFISCWFFSISEVSLVNFPAACTMPGRCVSWTVFPFVSCISPTISDGSNFTSTWFQPRTVPYKWDFSYELIQKMELPVSKGSLLGVRIWFPTYLPHIKSILSLVLGMRRWK